MDKRRASTFVSARLFNPLVLAERPLLDRRGELLDDLEVHVRLEQREPYLAHRLVDVVLGQLAARADVAEGGLEPVGKSVEH